jgi:putative transcriptional regulator
MQNLTGKLLIAMPEMGDPRFEHSVVFLCEHSDQGAMGLIVNKPLDGLTFPDLLQQLKIDFSPKAEVSVHFGGPVEHGRGFVLHSQDYTGTGSTLDVVDDFSMTATQDILESIARGQGPIRSLLALGYAGWGPGQLEDEIQTNGWLTCDATPEIVFAEEDSTKWSAALRSLGVDPLTLSAAAGRA